MIFASVVQNYLLWHYSRAFSEIYHVWFNLVWFTLHFFSTPQLFKSLFSPWKRIAEKRHEKWNLEDLAEYLLIGFVSRLIGFTIRSIFILIGISVLLLVILVGAIVYILWAFLPILVIAMSIYGLSLLFISIK